MKIETFKRIKIMTTTFVATTVGMAVVRNNIYLALGAVLIGLLFLALVRLKTKSVLTDERIAAIGGYAARATYIIITATTAFLSLVFTMSGRRAGDLQIEALGTILSYITLLSMAVYSISYKYFSKKYGDEDDEQN